MTDDLRSGVNLNSRDGYKPASASDVPEEKKQEPPQEMPPVTVAKEESKGDERKEAEQKKTEDAPTPESKAGKTPATGQTHATSAVVIPKAQQANGEPSIPLKATEKAKPSASKPRKPPKKKDVALCLPPELEVTGDIFFGGTLQMEGSITGTLTSAGDVTILGEVTGDVRSTEGYVTVEDSGKVGGNITSHGLTIKPKASFSGKYEVYQEITEEEKER